MSTQFTTTRQTAPENLNRVGKSAGSGGSRSMTAGRGASKTKWMCWASAGVAVVLLVLFVLDFIMKLTGSTTFRPFGALDYVVDAVCALAAAILIYLSLDALRSLR